MALDPSDRERVRRVLFLHGLRGRDIEDAAQQVELRLVERAPAVLQSASAWACAVAANLAVDLTRRRGRRVEAERRLAVAARAEASGEDVALRLAIRTALAQLEPELTAVVVLRFYVDLSVADIAAAMNVPEGTVKSRLHRATAQLRRALPKESLEP